MDIKKYLPSIITAAVAIFVILIIPSQIDLSRVRSGNITGVNSRVIPYSISFLILFLSCIEIILKIKTNENDIVNKNNKDTLDNSALLRVSVTAVSILLWILLISVLGFILSTFILMVFIMVLMGNRRWFIMASTSLITTVALYFVFTKVIGRSLPSGLFF